MGQGTVAGSRGQALGEYGLDRRGRGPAAGPVPGAQWVEPAAQPKPRPHCRGRPRLQDGGHAPATCSHRCPQEGQQRGGRGLGEERRGCRWPPPRSHLPSAACRSKGPVQGRERARSLDSLSASMPAGHLLLSQPPLPWKPLRPQMPRPGPTPPLHPPAAWPSASVTHPGSFSAKAPWYLQWVWCRVLGGSPNHSQPARSGTCSPHALLLGQPLKQTGWCLST